MIKNKISLLSLKKFFLKIPDILFTSANLKILYSIQPEVKGCLLDKLFLKLAYRGGEHKNLKIKKVVTSPLPQKPYSLVTFTSKNPLSPPSDPHS